MYLQIHALVLRAANIARAIHPPCHWESLMSSQQLLGEPTRNERWLSRVHDFLSRDLCPAADKWIAWIKNPFWVMAASMLAAVLCGVFVSHSVLVFGVGLAITLAVGIVWPWLSLRGVHGQVRFLQIRGRIGQPVIVEVELINRWPWPVWGLELSRGFTCHDGSSAGGLTLAWIPGWSKYRTKWKFVPCRRGVYPYQVPELESGFPFGLLRARCGLRTENELIVWPRSISLDQFPSIDVCDSRDDRTSSRNAGNLGDVIGTRTFRQGDSLRRVHWAQSARQGQLIVTERQRPVSCALRLILDLDCRHHRMSGSFSSLESLLSIAASVMESLHREQAFVECVIGSDIYRIGSSPADVRRCLDALSRIPLRGIDSVATREQDATFRRSRHALQEYVLTTSVGVTMLPLMMKSGSRAQLIVLNHADELATVHDRDDRRCQCGAWLELSTSSDQDILATLPAFWRKACHANS